jgi:hypothetical protein
MVLPEEVRSYLERELAEARKAAPGLVSADGRALMVTGSIGYCGYIAPDGDIYMERDVDLDGTFHVDRSWRAQIEVIVLASRRRPELQAILPRRTSGDLDCAQCRGDGWMRIPVDPPGKILCLSCGGLGWILVSREGEPVT